ncbi:MAG: sulfate permease [Cyanobium sp.]
MNTTPVFHLPALIPAAPRRGGDLLAGLTVAAYLIPQCLAYGELAGLAPIQGLWAVLPPLLLYAVLGSSPQLSVGPESTTAVMTAAAIAPLAAGDATAAAALSSLLALLVGLFCCLGAWARLGFLADLLSRPIMVGYLAGVALIMISDQIGRICGLELPDGTLPMRLLTLLQRSGEVHPATLLLAVAVLLFLWLLERRFPRLPAPLLAVLLATAAVAVLGLEERGVAVIGAIPTGLPAVGWPATVPLPQLRALIPAALGIALVGYSDNVLTARGFAARRGYRIDANRELLALGLINLGSGLGRGFPVSSGSRTALGDALGSRSQRFSLVALAAVLAVLVFLRPLLARFPLAALGAIVIYAALQLIDRSVFRSLRQFRPSEFRLALITAAGVLLTDILLGVAVAVALSVIDLFARIVRPHDAVMGEVPQLAGLHDVSDWPGARTRPGLLLYRYDAPLCFANADHFQRRVLDAVEAETVPVRWVVINAEAIVEIDATAAERLEQLVEELQQRGIIVAMARVKQDLYRQLQRTRIVEQLGQERFFPTLPSAVAAFEAAAKPAGAAAGS